LKTDVLIVGGGLAGLYLAWLLEQRGVDYQLIEARGRWGGRILSHEITVDGNTASFDLGPAWFWPGQPRIANLLATLEIEPFQQFSTGENISEDEFGRIYRGAGFASMQGSYRLDGGIGVLIEKIKERIPGERMLLNRKAVFISRRDQIVSTEIESMEETTRTLQSNCIVLAVPPRLVAETINFSPKLSGDTIDALNQIPTWMAGHAKVIAVYKSAFWRAVGLSGDAMSRRGPMVEIHDASPRAGGPFALFGFVGYPPNIRMENKEALLTQARNQLAHLFGPVAASPEKILIQDWAFDQHTATSLDHVGLTVHPAYGLPAKLAHIWDGRLVLGSTETAPQFGGFLEGALEAAESTFENIIQRVGV
jgi:monoamine oxidase